MKANVAVQQPQAGLLTGPARKPVPLEGVKIHAEVLGHASRVTLAQRFRNAEKVPIEAVYVFPVPEAAAVCGLAMRVGERRIEGQVWEREKAFEIYDDAMAAGHGAVLVDAERPNIFTASVGNILPGQEVVVELTWAAELGMEGEAIRFVLPTTVAPRYAPEEDQRGVSPTRAERVSPPVELDVPYGLDLEVAIALPCPVRAVDSPSHPVRFEVNGTRARVTLSHAAAAMDRDFVLLITPQEAHRPQVLAERNEDGLVTAAVSIVPQLEGSRGGSEVVFVVDRSGSMGGSSIEQVRAALHLCLRSLKEGDRFNIVGFGSGFVALFPESKPYSQATLEQASEHVDGMGADMGGTEILPVLKAVLEREPAAGLGRQIVLLTDGEVSNEAAVVELARNHRAHTRIFTFGIGHGASEHLVRAVARVTLAEAEFIHPGERIEPKVLRQFARLGTPALRGVKVEWQGVSVKLQAPHRPPAIFNGEPAVLYARFEGKGPGTVTLSGTADGKPLSWNVNVDPAQAGPGDLLATLAARAAIRDLEEGTSALHESARGSAQRGRREERIRKEIVALATAYRLASSETSFVAVEQREGAEGQPAAELRQVPVSLTYGWGGIGADTAFGSTHFMAAGARVASMPALDMQQVNEGEPQFLRPRRVPPAQPADAPLARPSCQPAAAPKSAAAGGDGSLVQIRDASTGRRGLPDSPFGGGELGRFPGGPSPAGGVGPHLDVVQLQQADGSWKLNGELARALGVKLEKLRKIAETVGKGGTWHDVVATLAALRYLQTRAAHFEGEWRLLAEKAERWLTNALAGRPARERASVEGQVASLLRDRL
jgi:Ca-activated chloride channel family protein